MKNSLPLKLLAALLLLVTLTVPALVACNGPQEQGSETTLGESEAPIGDATTSPSLLPPAVTGKVLTDKTRFELESGDSIVKLGVQNGSLFIIGLQTKDSGINRIKSPVSINLPQQVKIGNRFEDMSWRYVGYLNHRPENSDFTEYGYIFRFAEDTYRLQYDLYVTAHYEFDGPAEMTGYLTNLSRGALTVRPGDYFRIRSQGEDVPLVWTVDKESGSAEGWKLYDGTYVAGTGITKTRMTAGKRVDAVTSTNQGWNCGGDIPMIYVEHEGWGLYYGVEWSNCHIIAESAGSGDVTVSAGLGERNFLTSLPKEQTLYLPTVYLGVYDGDVDDGSNVFKRWFLYNKSPEIILENKNEPLTQSDVQHDVSVSKSGIQSVKWDYGWWSTEVAPGHTRWQVKEGLLELDWNTGYASWITRYKLDSMKKYSELLKRNGMSWAVYVLLKDCEQDRPDVPTSVGKNGHPEWFSNRKITVGRSADLGNVDCVAFYKDYLLSFFKDNGITTWRSDFEPICYTSDKTNRHAANGSDVQYWCTVGFLELVDHLYENLEGFRYESCSSGGSMKDLLTATRAVVINCDDSADFMSLKMSFYDSSYMIHPAQLQLPTNCLTYVSTSKYYAGIGNYVYGLRSQLVGAAMLCNWEGGRNTEPAYWNKYLTVYNARIKPLIRYGDLYHIFDRPDGVHWDGFAYIDADAESSTKGIVMLWRPTEQDDESKTIKLRGLNEDTVYQVKFHDREEQSCEMTGKDLMEKGFTATLAEAGSSEWVWIVEK